MFLISWKFTYNFILAELWQILKIQVKPCKSINLVASATNIFRRISVLMSLFVR